MVLNDYTGFVRKVIDKEAAVHVMSQVTGFE